MRFIMHCLLAVLLVAGPALAADGKKQGELTSYKQKLSYTLGLDLGAYFKSLGEDLDLVNIQHGIEDAYQGRKPLLSTEESAGIQQKFARKQQEKRLQKTREMMIRNRKAADDFLKENGKKDGVQTTASGLQYKLIKAGDGATPKADDTVKVQYRGTLLNGTEFDSSYKRGKPAVFSVNQVIPGWTEALQLMKVGSKYRIFLPPDLAYGDRGAPPVIAPGSMLIFDVELVDIVKKKK